MVQGSSSESTSNRFEVGFYPIHKGRTRRIMRNLKKYNVKGDTMSARLTEWPAIVGRRKSYGKCRLVALRL
jgi:hypothetical protein